MRSKANLAVVILGFFIYLCIPCLSGAAREGGVNCCNEGLRLKLSIDNAVVDGKDRHEVQVGLINEGKTSVILVAEHALDRYEGD